MRVHNEFLLAMLNRCQTVTGTSIIILIHVVYSLNYFTISFTIFNYFISGSKDLSRIPSTIQSPPPQRQKASKKPFVKANFTVSTPAFSVSTPMFSVSTRALWFSA